MKCNGINDIGLLASRILLTMLFITAGYSKIGGYEGTLGYMQSMGVPGFLLPFTILLELGGGLAVLFGLFTRPIAVIFAVFSILAAFLFHNDGEYTNQLMFWKNISIAGGFLALAAAGAGKYSIDHLWCKKCKKKTDSVDHPAE